MFDAIVALAALYGALTGTIALYLQIVGHRKDRAALYLAARIVHGGKLKKYLELTLTNRGKRVIRINEIGIDFARMEDPLNSQTLSTSLSPVIFGGKQGLMSLEEGEQRVIETDWAFYEAPDLINDQREHVLYVSTTEGKRYTLGFKRYRSSTTGDNLGIIIA